MKIRRGDTVVVTAGKDKGKTGQVLKVLHAKNKVVISDVNMRTRHKKKTPNQAGEIIKYEASMSASNVSLIDPKTRKPTRAGWKIDEKGRKIRIAKKSGEEIVRGKVTLDKAPRKAAKKAGDADAKEEQKTEALAAKDTQKKPAFWKKMGFGAEALAEAEIPTESHMQEDHSIAAETQHRSSGRGS